MTQHLLVTLAMMLFITSPILAGCYLSKTRSKYRIKETENSFIPQVRKGLSWYSLNNSNTALYYDQAINERTHCRCYTMDEAIKVLDRYKEAIREKEVKYHEYK